MNAAPLYRIAGWHDHFEHRDGAKTKGPLKWVSLPVKTDGLGFGRIRQQEDRAELYAAWVLMLSVAAKQNAGRRGDLSREGRPLTAKDLEIMTGFPEKIFLRALDFYANPDQGWLTVHEFCEISRDRAKNAPTIHHLTKHHPLGAADASPAVEAKREVKPEGPRNPILDALATVGGGDVTQVTATSWGAAARALKEIKDVCPDLTPAEIQRRAINYGLRFTGATLSASALCKHWAACDAPPRPKNGPQAARAEGVWALRQRQDAIKARIRHLERDGSFYRTAAECGPGEMPGEFLKPETAKEIHLERKKLNAIDEQIAHTETPCE